MKRSNFLKAMGLLPAIGVAGIAKLFEEEPDKPGINGTSFKIKLDRSWWRPEDCVIRNDVYRNMHTGMIIIIRDIVGYRDLSSDLPITNISEQNDSNFFFIGSSFLQYRDTNGYQEIKNLYSFKTIKEEFKFVHTVTVKKVSVL